MQQEEGKENKINEIYNTGFVGKELENLADSASSFVSQIKIPHSLIDSLNTANAISQSLSVAMPDPKLFESYNGALALQKTALENFSCINKELEPINGAFANIIASASVPIAEIGLVTANANRLLDFGTISEDNFLALGKVSNLCLDAIKTQQESLIFGLQQINDFAKVTGGTVSSLTLPFQTVNSGIDQIMRSVDGFPANVLPDFQVIRRETSVSEEDYQSLLDQQLEEIDPSLAKCRHGCWSTFEAKKDDYIGQATSSMRRLVDKFLNIVAPIEEVKKSSYYQEAVKSGASEKSTKRRARIYYAVNYDCKRTEHLQRLTKGFLEIYDNLSAWDHNPTNDDQFVHGTFMTIEGLLLSILSEIKK
ncbi:MAG TPA: hypothetical protein P5080_01985 [Candidatus Paceibacterota bacterium]|nr:hypothetical protein [Candidatus Pacearchaeota archaeon]HRZ50641.1 hypothetical protein [Candidatus Paceibacterota bacterium]HSA36462.1 hypothetical protein [Candidatus Paceibacterota bacterium]